MMKVHVKAVVKKCLDDEVYKLKRIRSFMVHEKKKL